MVTLRFADGTEKQVGDFFMGYSDMEKVYFLQGSDHMHTPDPNIFLAAVKNRFADAALGFPGPDQVVVLEDGYERLYHYSHAKGDFSA